MSVKRCNINKVSICINKTPLRLCRDRQQILEGIVETAAIALQTHCWVNHINVLLSAYVFVEQSVSLTVSLTLPASWLSIFCNFFTGKCFYLISWAYQFFQMFCLYYGQLYVIFRHYSHFCAKSFHAITPFSFFVHFKSNSIRYIIINNLLQFCF